MRCKVLQLEDQVYSSIHIWHDVVWLHQAGIEGEIPVAVEDVLSDAVSGGQGHLAVGAVHPGTDQHRAAAGSSCRCQLLLPAEARLMGLGEQGRGSACRSLGLQAGFGALLQVAVVQVSSVHIRHQIVPETRNSVSTAASALKRHS